MKQQEYDNQTLTAYLLGSLPDADAERFDELSFTDDAFSDALKSVENDLTDKYVRGELSGATLEQFQTHYLASPLRRQRVEFAEALNVHTKKHFAAINEISTLVETKPEKTISEKIAGFFTIPRFSMQWGFALAALALVFFGGWLWRENSRLNSEIAQANQNRDEIIKRESELADREKQLQEQVAAQGSAVSENEKELAQIREERARLEEQLKKQTLEKQRLAEQQKFNEQQRAAQNKPPVSNAPTVPRGGIASFILAPSLRGGNRIQTVSIPARTAGVAAALEIESDEYAVYRAVLKNASDDRTVWQSGKLKSKSVGGNSRVSVNFPAALLKEEIYSIELTGVAKDGAEEIIGNYSFRVMR